MERILISACLLGQNVRYDGGHCLVDHEIFKKWQAEGRLVAICPEMAGGLPAPRPPCEIKQGHVMDKDGVDYTDQFNTGAKQALELAKNHQIKYALLKEQSPSCGVHVIYDGSFKSQKIDGSGITAQALKAVGLQIFSDLEIEELQKMILRECNNEKALL